MKTIGTVVGGPLFERVKQAMGSFTALMMPKLDENAPFFKSMKGIGTILSSSAGHIAKQWQSIFPNVSSGVDGLAASLQHGVLVVMSRVEMVSGYLVDHWAQIRDGAVHFAKTIEHAAESAMQIVSAIGGGDLGKGMERVVLALGAGKLASTAAAPVKETAAVASSIGIALRSAGMIGGGAGAAGTAATAAGTAGAAGGGGTAATAATAVSSIGAGTVAAVIAVVAAIGASIVEAFKANLWGTTDIVMDLVSKIGTSFSELGTAAVALYDAIRPGLALIGVVFVAAITGVLVVVKVLVDLLTLIATSLATFGDNVRMIFNTLEDLAPKGSALAEALAMAAEAMNTLTNAAHRFGLVSSASAGAKAYDARHAAGDLAETIANEEYAKSFAMSPGGLGAYNAKKSSSLKSGGGKQQIEVKLKIDLNGGENEEALFIRSKKSIMRAIEEASNQARISTSTIRGVTT
jgi:hypothetical protein